VSISRSSAGLGFSRVTLLLLPDGPKLQLSRTRSGCLYDSLGHSPAAEDLANGRWRHSELLGKTPDLSAITEQHSADFC